jgi:hypothetical protein
MMPDVGPDSRDPSDLDHRTSGGLVVWGPLPAVDPLRRYRSEALGTLVHDDEPPRAKPTKAERRRAARAKARSIRRQQQFNAAIQRAA